VITKIQQQASPQVQPEPQPAPAEEGEEA